MYIYSVRVEQGSLYCRGNIVGTQRYSFASHATEDVLAALEKPPTSDRIEPITTEAKGKHATVYTTEA